MENKLMDSKNKRLFILLGVLAVIAIIIIVVASKGNGPAVNSGNNAAVGTQAGETKTTPDSTTPSATSTPAPAVSEILKDTRVEVPNANPITKDNKVITMEGKETKNNVEQTSPLAPAQTGPVSKASLSAGVIKLDVTMSGFSPKEFTVKAGAPITVSITSTDSYVHTFVFDDASLSAIGLGVYAGETRAVTFNAPTKAGSYTFYSNAGTQKSAGVVGTMIVK